MKLTQLVLTFGLIFAAASCGSEDSGPVDDASSKDAATTDAVTADGRTVDGHDDGLITNAGQSTE